MRSKVEMIDTTNPRFKYLIGKSVWAEDFKIGTLIWFKDFHTSNLVSLNYKYTDGHTDITADTLNSTYKFRIKESN